MTRRIVFTVPGEPQGKARTRHNGGKHFLTSQTRAYQKLIGQCAFAERRGQMLTGPLRMDLDIECAIPKAASKPKREAMLLGQEWPTKTPDVDNIIKAICDGAQGVAFEDDKQVVCITATKRYGDTPCVRVRIAPMIPAHSEET